MHWDEFDGFAIADSKRTLGITAVAAYRIQPDARQDGHHLAVQGASVPGSATRIVGCTKQAGLWQLPRKIEDRSVAPGIARP